MSDLTTDLHHRLIKGGWTLKRRGKHRVYEHSNGAVHVVSTTVKDIGVDRKRAMKEIAAKEKDPRRCSRIPLVIDQEAPVPTPSPSPSPSLLPTSAPTSDVPTKRAGQPFVWFSWVRSQREFLRMKRADLAAKMAPFIWTSSTVRAIETGKLMFGKSELAHWAEVVEADIAREAKGTIPTLLDDDSTVLARTRKPAVLHVPATVEPQAPGTCSSTLPAWAVYLRARRVEANLSQGGLGAKVGVSQSRISRAEAGRPVLTQEEWDRIKKALYIPFDAPEVRVVPVLPTTPTEASGAGEEPVTCSEALPQVDTRVESTVCGQHDRQHDIDMVVRLLSNPRLTDREVADLACDLRNKVIETLIGGL